MIFAGVNTPLMDSGIQFIRSMTEDRDNQEFLKHMIVFIVKIRIFRLHSCDVKVTMFQISNPVSRL